MIKMFDVPEKVARPIEAFWGNRVTLEENDYSERLYNLTFQDAGLSYFGDDPGKDTLAVFNKEIGVYSTFSITDFSEVHII